MPERYILSIKMNANLSRFWFTFRYWQTVAGAAE
jgi:hypothetical protein